MHPHYYNLKLHRVLISDLILVRKPDDSAKTRIFIKGLEESIAELGVLMPLLVMKSPDYEHKFVLLDGYKRLEVLKHLENNILAVNVLIAEGSQENISFSVNRVRGELSKLYQAMYIYNIMIKEKISQDELSRRFMMSKGEISKLLSVVRQPSLVKMVKSGMSMTNAKCLAVSLSGLKHEQKEKQINNVKVALPNEEDISTRKFEKLTKVISKYNEKTNQVLDSRDIKKVYDYMEKNENTFISPEKLVTSLIKTHNIETPQLRPAKFLEAVRTMCDNISSENIKFDINNSGSVSFRMKMNAEEFRKFKAIIGERYFDNSGNYSS
ncbi:MAG: ParB N-terminal domain-containing protein [Candidatus Sericytochromatia bacterium]